MSFQPTSKKEQRKGQMWRGGVWAIANRLSLHGTLESLAPFSFLGLETYALLAWLHAWTFCCPCDVPLSSVEFLRKIPACFAVWRETMFFCSCLSQRVRTTRSLLQGGGQDGTGWRGQGCRGRYQSERSLRGRPTCAHTPGPPSPLCIMARGRLVKGGVAFYLTCAVVLSRL